ncbi:FHA domain-containing protein [Agromyces humatus]|nr:FHA domain-containing protein [Agromyces humatus]
MPRGSVTSAATAGASAWDVIVGDRFIVVLAAPAPDAVLASLAEAASESAPGLEEIVGRLPFGDVDSIESFALVWWPGDEPSELTAVVRGDAVVDLESPGGSRRFDAREIRPWLLAEFHDVTRLRLTGADASLEPLRGGEPVRHARASLRASAVEWTPATDPEPTKPVTLVAAPGNPDAAFAPVDGRPPAPDARTGTSPSVDADTVMLGRSRVDADTIIVPRRQLGPGGGSSAPLVRDPTAAGAANGRGEASAGDLGSGETAGDPALIATVPQVRIAGGPVRSVTTPLLIGRRPSPPRIARVGGIQPELVTVESRGGFISATHLELRVEGTRLVATDLRSTNGTTLRSAGGARQRLRSGESIVVIPGAELDLGDDTIIEILPPRGDDRRTRPDSRLQT